MANSMPNSAKVMLHKGQIKIANQAGTGAADTFKIILMQPGFVFDPTTHHSYANVISYEVATGTGYTTGGATLTGVTVSVDHTNSRSVAAWSNVQWGATGGSIVASGAIIYDDTTDAATADYTDAILSYKDAGGTITAVDGTPIVISSIQEVLT